MAQTIQADWLTRPATQAVFNALAAAGHEARAVGGAVRNTLIGKPASDIDLATPAKPEATMAAAERAGLAVIPTGLQHGTVTIMSGGIPYEVTTLRRDVETDGRHAVVAFTEDWAADAARRDFTINALYCAADGTLLDPLGGYPDLVARRVRFIGDADARIREDYLRILRFFRFTAEYAAGAPDAVGLLACSRLRDGMRQLSAERIRTELLKLLVAPRAKDIATVMLEYGYWPALLGVVPHIPHLQRHTERHPASDAILRLATLAVTTTEDASRLSARLKLTRKQEALLLAIAKLTRKLEPAMSDHAARCLLYAEGREAAHAACVVAEARYVGNWSVLAATISDKPIPVFPVRGQDLLNLGMAAGPLTGATLRKLEQAWIGSDFTLKRDALLELMDKPS